MFHRCIPGFVRLTRVLPTMLVALSIVACDIVLPDSQPSAAPTPSYTLGNLRPGNSEIRQRTTFHRVRNCQGTNNPLRLSSNYNLSNSVEWRVGSRAGFGVQIGSDAVPISISLEAALDGQLAAQVTSGENRAEEQTLSGLPNAIVEYEIHWFETWQSATIPLIPPIGDVLPIEVTYLTNVQTEIANENVFECPNAPQTSQLPTQVPFPTQVSSLRTEAAPTTSPVVSSISSALDALFGANNWFCFPDKQNAVGVRFLPPGLVVRSPIDQIDTYVGSFYQGETVSIRTGATAWLEGFIPLDSCPASQRQALLNWTPDGRSVTREYLDNVFGSQNWECSDQFSFLILVDELPQDFYVEYPFTSVDTSTHLNYGVGDIVPGGSGASVWTLEISRSQCR